jgi:hypothetical protein
MKKKLLAFKMILFFLLFFNSNIAKAMITQSTKIEILNKNPNQIYAFMFGLNKEIYTGWHPEHLDFKIIKQTPDTLGSIFYFHEKLDNLKIKYNWEVTLLEPNHKIVMTAKYFIPIHLILIFDKTEKGTLVTHDLQIGTEKEGILDWFISKFIFTKRKKQSQDRHAVEEFKNLEKLII